MESIEIPGLIDFTQAAIYLKVSRPTIYNLIKRGKLHPVVVGRCRYLLEAEVVSLDGQV